MKKLLALRHVDFENLGTFEDFFSEAGFAIQYLDTPTANPGALAAIDAAGPDLLVVLGGPMGVYETDAYPFLREEIALIKARIDQGLPTFGICLGAQLIAAAMGAQVYPGKVKEIGWAPVTLTAEGRCSPLAMLGINNGNDAADSAESNEATAPSVLHWHGDTFDLPAGAVRLASTADYANQAFALERHVLALQFHLEVQPDAIGPWIDGNTAELAAAGIAPEPLLQARNAITPQTARGIMTAWMAQLAVWKR